MEPSNFTILTKGEWIHFIGRQLLSKMLCLPFEKGSNLKEKNFGSKFFPFIVGPFLEWDCFAGKQTGNQKLTEVYSVLLEIQNICETLSRLPGCIGCSGSGPLIFT